MSSFVRQLPQILKDTAKAWMDDNAMRLAAALSYYTVFSLVPLILASIAVAGLVFGKEAATGQIFGEMQSMLGPAAAASVEQLVLSASKPESGYTGAILGFLLGLFGASGVFGELMGSLNQIWGVKSAEGNGIWLWIKGRFLSIGMVMGVVFLLLVSLLLGALLGAASRYGFSWLPEGAAIAGQVLGFILSFGLVTVLFAAMFRFLPATPIQWKDVWTGAVGTALLFSLGKFGLEQYLTRAQVASGFGAAGALAVLLVWVYYSAQIFFFGAEFTKVYAHRRHSVAAPEADSFLSSSNPEPAIPPDGGLHPEPVLASGMHGGYSGVTHGRAGEAAWGILLLLGGVLWSYHRHRFPANRHNR